MSVPALFEELGKFVNEEEAKETAFSVEAVGLASLNVVRIFI